MSKRKWKERHGGGRATPVSPPKSINTSSPWRDHRGNAGSPWSAVSGGSSAWSASSASPTRAPISPLRTPVSPDPRMNHLIGRFFDHQLASPRPV
jgi:hypothetical protein